MSYSIIYPNGENRTVSVASGAKIAVKSKGKFIVYQVVGYPNLPTQKTLLSETENDEYISSAFSAATTVEIEGGASEVHYTTGTDTQVLDEGGVRTNITVGALNATGTLTTALCLGGVVTSTTAAGVTATLDTGALTELGSNFQIGEAFEWSVINTGGNTLTVTASTGHTIVGVGAVLTVTSARFATLKTAASTYVTYRLS